MNLPGANANAPATIAPIIVPIMNAACRFTFPRLMETNAAAIQNNAHTLRPCIQLNSP